jgi:hypothetical protein
MIEKQTYEPEIQDDLDPGRHNAAEPVIATEHGTTSDYRASDQRTTANALFAGDEAQSFRSRWEKIQIGFVDEPRVSVKQADELVADVIRRLSEVFAGERQRLEHDWDRGDDISTEDLRVALQKYRSFFDRLLSV